MPSLVLCRHHYHYHYHHYDHYYHYYYYCLRYLAEFQAGDVRKESSAEALEAYNSASNIANQVGYSLGIPSPPRLDYHLCLHFTIVTPLFTLILYLYIHTFTCTFVHLLILICILMQTLIQTYTYVHILLLGASTNTPYSFRTCIEFFCILLRDFEFS